MVAHDVIIGGAEGKGSVGPLILRRTDQEFIPALLDELAVEGGLQAAIEKALNTPDRVTALKLFQPVHRTFYLAVIDVACEGYKRPRLDPQRIESAGLVVRRIAEEVNEGGQRIRLPVMEAWVQDGRTFRGWVRFRQVEHDRRLDPEPGLRSPVLRSGNAELDRLLARLPSDATSVIGRESVSPLFVAPPEVCKATGRTLLYGLISVTSPEVSEQQPQTPPYDEQWFQDRNFRAHLPPFMRAGADIPFPQGRSLTAQNVDEEGLHDFIVMLRQVKFEFDAFGDSKPSQDLLAALNQVTLDPNTNAARRMGDFLQEASRVLVDQEKGRSVTMPTQWPRMNETVGKAVLEMVREGLRERLKGFTAGQGRFDEPDRQYRIRAFVRVRQPDNCPPRPVWSDYSQPFTIAPWYENTELPPVQVALPDVLNRDTLKQLKPNVAFSVPSQLFNFLQQNDPKKLMDGSGSDGGGGVTLDWICGFSIPIITLCAFIVLNIFLQLFDLIFRWLLFIKICIPFPRRK